jgi:hypothetical protein
LTSKDLQNTKGSVISLSKIKSCTSVADFQPTPIPPHFKKKHTHNTTRTHAKITGAQNLPVSSLISVLLDRVDLVLEDEDTTVGDALPLGVFGPSEALKDFVELPPGDGACWMDG